MGPFGDEGVAPLDKVNTGAKRQLDGHLELFLILTLTIFICHLPGHGQLR
jgi:hypothetical protein